MNTSQEQSLIAKNAALEKELAAKNRELEIEASLDRVRARTMAMQKSEELAETASVLFQQMNALGNTPERLNIGIIKEDEGFIETWATEQGGNQINHTFNARLNELTTIAKLFEGWKAKKNSMVVDLSGNELKQWIHYLKNELKMPLKEELLQKRRVQTVAYFKQGFILMTTPEPLPLETINLLERFAKVFDQTYVRFLDLQKAEAQTREAKIEAALERVRARAMAMQTSEDLNGLIGIVFTELTKLDLVLTRCVIIIYDTETKGAQWWMANSEAPSAPMNFFVKYANLPYFNISLKGWEERDLKWQYILEGENKIVTDNFLFNETELKTLPRSVIEGMKAPHKVYLNASFNNFGNLRLVTLEPLSEKHFDILLRFAKVFDLTYTRFNDLQKAEANAREAKIEAALERVRGKAMAMYNSSDLTEAAGTLFTELNKLGIHPTRTGFVLLTKDSRRAKPYTAASFDNKSTISITSEFDLIGNPFFEKQYESWQNKEDYFPVLENEEELKTYYKVLSDNLSALYENIPINKKQFGSFLPFSEGFFFAWSGKPYSEKEINILHRFKSILDLAIKRFLDLQKSETATKEAVKQAALDRIRADIASMRTINDLDRITPLIWNELNILGVPFIRCGVFIMDDEQQLIHTFLSTPEGKAITAFHLPYSTPGNISFVLKNWRNHKNYIDHWDEQTFTEFAHSLEQQKVLSSVNDYMETLPAGGFYLHFLPFLQGMLYVGNTDQLNEEQISLLQSVADAFATAYARYEDFNKLEAAKKQVDNTLAELKSTQKQLIQSEKMASLGELTAGIAHEIQNPLNFVNNFSEVNTELIDEMKNEFAKGNGQLAMDIANDIKENEEKIIHHGKRADAIVKGMLQHSRTSTGKKKPTNINALADEYFRLSYHGMRAKDKSFNATMKTDFDETIGKINVVPQDIGRVLLNLFNNAFYAASQPSKGGLSAVLPKREPTVWVSTKRITDGIPPSGGTRGAGAVEIRVRDNGNGIPEKIKDKIFQPFFTTKPTGEGTGLGLSLSYDMIKAHGGEITVETKEHEFTEFVIILPD